MIDIREQLLAQLVIVYEGITGIEAVARNALDIVGIKRPAILVNDGSEELVLERPNSVRRFGQIQIMDLTPDVRLLLRADDGNEGGALISLFRARIILATLNDIGLRNILGANGAMRYAGCSTPDPSPESRFPRLDLTFIFSYPLKLSDLT